MSNLRVFRLVSLFVILLIVAAILVLLDAYARGQFSSNATISSAHFELSGIEKEKAEEVLQQLESNYDRIGVDLKIQPSTKIRVYVYTNRWAYGRATGNWTAGGNPEGPEIIHLLWNGKNTGQNAIHEFAHTVTLRLLIDHAPQPLDPAEFDKKFATLPIWLWEAVALYEANQAHNPLLFQYMSNGKYPSLQELNQRSKGAKIYDVGFALVEFIEYKWGHDRLIQLLLEYGDLQKMLNISEDEFSKQWNEFIRDKY